MNESKKENYRFSRLSDNQKVYLISIRQQKIIPAHGSKRHFNRNIQTQLTESWWKLLPGTYFLFEHNKNEKHHGLHRLVIQKGKNGIYEKYESIKKIPDWLYALVSGLPEFNEDYFNEKHTIYSTSQSTNP